MLSLRYVVNEYYDFWSPRPSDNMPVKTVKKNVNGISLGKRKSNKNDKIRGKFKTEST